MNTMTPLLNVKIYQDYSEVFPLDKIKVSSRMEIRKILGGSRFPLVHAQPDVWAIYGDRDDLADHLSNSPEGLALELDIEIKDPGFLYYMTSLTPDTQGDTDIQLIQEQPGMSRLKAIIRITSRMLAEACPIEKEVRYTSRENVWKFILIPRVSGSENRRIRLEDSRGIVSFNETERSRWMDKPIFVTSTTRPVKLKKYSSAHDAPDICVFEQQEYGKKILVKHVPIPQPGQFLIKEFQQDNEILQFLYI